MCTELMLALSVRGSEAKATVMETPCARQRGVSLIELVMFIVIISVALLALLGVMNTVTKGSADPMLHKQALAIAESLLEEIEAQDFSIQAGVAATSGPVNASNRATGYHIVSEYNGFTMAGITSINGAAVSGLGAYSASVSAVNQALGTIPATSAVQISVTVTPPSGDAITAVGYRVAY